MTYMVTNPSGETDDWSLKKYGVVHTSIWCIVRHLPTYKRNTEAKRRKNRRIQHIIRRILVVLPLGLCMTPYIHSCSPHLINVFSSFSSSPNPHNYNRSLSSHKSWSLRPSNFCIYWLKIFIMAGTAGKKESPLKLVSSVQKDSYSFLLCWQLTVCWFLSLSLLGSTLMYTEKDLYAYLQLCRAVKDFLGFAHEWTGRSLSWNAGQEGSLVEIHEKRG